MRKYQDWVLLTLVMASVPSLLHLPLWVSGVAVGGALLHYITPLRNSLWGKFVSAIVVIGVCTSIYYTFPSWFSGDAVLCFFITVVFLKWGESTTRRDYLLLIFSAVILATVGTLYWENMLNMVHIMVVVFLLIVSLIAIHSDTAQVGYKGLLKSSCKLFGLSVPLMLLLFVSFPRMSGQIWDVGLAFGLPVKALMDRGDSSFGKSQSLQPGGIQRAKKEEQNVLVAEFEGAVPIRSDLYWRGPVYWDYDGENWNLEENWDNRNRLLKRAIKSKKRLDRVLRKKSKQVRYSLRVMPNGGRWLYGVGFPAAPAPESFISDEFQLLSIRKIDDFEPKIEMTSYLEFEAGDILRDDQKKRGLAYPEGTNPRLRELGEKFAAKYHDSEEIAYQAYNYLRAGGYVYDDKHLIPPGPNAFDTFFFNDKKGGSEYLAGSFVMLMRAAGVPARLVSGYRGGTLIALTNFVIVKRENAHAWAEIWHENRGWVRADAKDIINPPEKAVAAPVQEKKINEHKIEISKEEQKQDLNVVVSKKKPSAQKKTEEKAGFNFQLPKWLSSMGNMQKWIINYNPDRQMELLKGVGLEQSNWIDLLVAGLVGSCSVLLMYFSFAWYRGRIIRGPVEGEWQRYLKKMNKLGCGKTTGECPRSYLHRIKEEKSELYPATSDIVKRYINLQYGAQSAKKDIADFKNQVEKFISMT